MQMCVLQSDQINFISCNQQLTTMADNIVLYIANG